MAHIFISYSREDSAYVDSLVSSLSQANFNVWLDRANIQVGQNWRAEIVEAIERADSFVLLVSRSSTASKYVRQEVYVADSSDREIASLYMEPLDLPSELKLPLAGLQIILLFEDWDAGYHQLVDILRKQQEAEQIKTKPPLPSTRRAELSIHKNKQNNEEKKEKLFSFLNEILGVVLDPAQIIEFNSEKIIINIPYHLSYELKAQALNNNPKLWEAGIKGLHFEGDKHNIPLQDPQIINSSYKGKETQQSISTSSSANIPKAKTKTPLIIGGLLIPLICIVVLFGIYLFNSVSRPEIAPSTSTNAPNTLLPDPPTLTHTPIPEPPTLTPTPTVTRTPTAVPAEILGIVWDDINGDGINSTGESPLADIPISLGLGSCDTSGFRDITSTDSATFNYSFSGLAAGTYCVSVDIEEICFEGPDVRELTTPKMQSITLLPGDQKIISFGSQEAICIK